MTRKEKRAWMRASLALLAAAVARMRRDQRAGAQPGATPGPAAPAKA